MVCLAVQQHAAVPRTADPPAPPAGPASGLECGDVVYVLFWRDNKMPDGSDRGHWDTLYGRVLAAGPNRVAYELGASADLPVDWGNEDNYLTPNRSTLRFARPAMAFRTPESARAAAAQMKPPAS